MPSWKKVIVSGSDANLNSLGVTTNITAPSFTGSLFGTSSFATTASFALNGGGDSINTSSFATTGSNIFSGSQIISGGLVVTNTSSSPNRFGAESSDEHIFSGSLILDGTLLLFSTGGITNVFGDDPSDAHHFSGSVNVDGPLTITGNQVITGSLDVTGAFTAESKSFKIVHPTQAGKLLVYGSLESPYHGVRLTGEGELVGNTTKIYLPEYIRGLCKQEGSQVQITNIQHDKVLWVDTISVEDNTFTVSCNRSFFDNKTYKFYWSFTAIRKDVEDLEVEIDF
jgi:hypothetical protein